MEQQLIALEQRIAALEQENQLLKSANSIPLSIDQAFRARFGTIVKTTLSATTYGHAVDEGGALTYSVLGNPTLFGSVTIANTTYYIPLY